MSTLNNLRRYWNTHVAWNCLSSVITDEREMMTVLNNYTRGGMMNEYTAVLCADYDGERLAVYGYSGSHPYDMSGNENVWGRIDGDRLPKRKDHFVITMTDHNGDVTSAHGTDLEAALNDFLIEDEEDFIDGFDDEWPDWIAMVMELRNAIRIPTRHNPVKLVVTTCDCAGHDYIKLLD